MSDQPVEIDALFSDRIRKFEEFLSSNEFNYSEQIRDMLRKNENRLQISLDDIREFDRQMWNGYVLNFPTSNVWFINLQNFQQSSRLSTPL